MDRSAVLDFTSALYLGMRHASEALRPWGQLSMGRPAALASPPNADAVAEQLAALLGSERATLVPSTLHLFWDLFAILASERIAIYMDAGTYAIVRWGVERAAARGTPVRIFQHHDPDALHDHLKRDARRGMQPVVVADGLCPACGASAPITAYLENVRTYDGYLVLDDTQALGILGRRQEPDAPYGMGGGGSLRWNRVSSPDVIVGSSLAKGFGVPVAVLAGSEMMVKRFEQASETRTHCSPSSNAVIHAAEHALAMNGEHGDDIRFRLWNLVGQLRRGLTEAGLSLHGGRFPVQTLALSPGLDHAELHEDLLRRGVRTVLHHARDGFRAQISFLITALHRFQDIDKTTEAVKQVAQLQGATLVPPEGTYEKPIQL
ncbi:MAG: hypothetical protein OEV99_04405 [Nitrospira sp.]|nr:hypothetical protein [Nitrospira sp.]MDH4369065.1 hypothetical protein [Nitrospira sp.]MDH5496728.1 hypothetical protein [Nitrospira sp.]